jgi:hypothetical protein
VFDLRAAAVEHGKAMARLDEHPSRQHREDVLETKMTLEEKTSLAIDECAENAEEAVQEAEAD